VEGAVSIPEGVFQETGIGDAPLHKVKTGWSHKCRRLPLFPQKEIIDDCHVMALVGQVFRDMRPDERGTAGDGVFLGLFVQA